MLIRQQNCSLEVCNQQQDDNIMQSKIALANQSFIAKVLQTSHHDLRIKDVTSYIPGSSPMYNTIVA